MKSTYDDKLKAHVLLDPASKVRQVRHSQEHWLGEQNVPRLAANEYLQSLAPTFDIPLEQMQALGKQVSYFDPQERGIEYQLSEIKHAFDSTTVGYYQTMFNVPVWRSGMAVQIKENPARVLSSTNHSEYGLKGKLPDVKLIERYKAMLLGVQRPKGEEPDAEDQEPLLALVQGVIGFGEEPTNNAANRGSVAILNGRFFVYRYDSKKRYAGKPQAPASAAAKATTGNPAAEPIETHDPAFLALPPVPATITDGQAYLVVEIIIRVDSTLAGDVVWLLLFEIETNAVLYAEPMTHGVNGLVFRRDPMVETGDLTVTSNLGNAVLNTHRDDVVLNDLAAPVGGIQSLTGTFVRIAEIELPSVASPTQPSGTDFDYAARTNHFAAVNAYYHQTELFRTIESLGFNVGSYFNGTTFPIPVDHRGLGTAINAHWSPNGTGGTGHMCYGLCDTTDTTNPLGRSVDPWVHWHEMGGHGTLGDHVGGGTLGFAHSAGDGLAALQMDPDSALRALPDRFRYAPFRPALNRRFDRPVAAWAWGSAGNDDGGYGSEEILATCHFRLYRAIGGDHADLNRRRFASRAATYLILRTTGNLTPGTNPNSPEAWCDEMQAADLQNWTSEGLFGGAYNKVARWAFEKQGAYQPVAAPANVTTPGAPPPVDVYIDDGRAGEYDFQPVHWHNTAMWNRNSADAGTAHQDAKLGQTNYMYVKVKNRGTTAATDVNVKGFHCLPGAGLTWPTDFTAMTPAGGLAVASIGANKSQEVVVGPFAWVPNTNVHGHDCVLMIATAPGDASNIDNFTAGESIEEWRLVPNDNNIGQRNVNLVPGGGGERGLMLGLHQHVFYAGNSFRRPAQMALRATLPPLLAQAGWQLKFEGLAEPTFKLKAGEKRKIVIELVPGAAFTSQQVRDAVERDIHVNLYGNDMLLGGMIYRLDADKVEPGNLPGTPPGSGGTDCRDKAAALLDCLKLGGAKVKKVCVKKVSLDIVMDNDCGCD